MNSLAIDAYSTTIERSNYTRAHTVSQILSGTVKNQTPSDQSTDDELLVAVAVMADTAAFNLLFGRFARRIHAMGVKLTQNDQLAKDLVQEAMLSVWQKARQFDSDRGSARAWIFTLVRNRCFDMLRQRNRQPGAVNADDIWEYDPDSEELYGQENQFFSELEISQFRKHYLKLPVAQQQVIEQVYINGQTQQETARILNIPQGTVKSRLRLGLEKLRQLMGITE